MDVQTVRAGQRRGPGACRVPAAVRAGRVCLANAAVASGRGSGRASPLSRAARRVQPVEGLRRCT